MNDEFSPDDFKYLRVGYFPRDRDTDKLVTHLVEQYPGDGVLPSRWRWISLEYFLNKYSYLGTFIWSKTASFHMLMFNGHHVFRLWTDSANTCVVDVSDVLAANLPSTFEVEDIPESCDRKCNPMTKRTRVASTADVDSLMNAVNHIYNIEKWRS